MTAVVDIVCEMGNPSLDEAPLPQLSNCGRESVHRNSFYLPSEHGALFAWLHHRSDHHQHGVVICPPIGFEQLHTHRSLRHLADQIALLQMPVLRFDWHGTGDSTGDDTDTDRYAAWVSNVRTTVRWMKDHYGCARVSVVGLRLGATLAALALDDDDIENLVLWSPVTTGRSFIREMNAIDMMSEARPQGEAASNVIETAGFRLTTETAAALSKYSLIQAKPRCQRILVVNRDDSTPDQRVIDHFCGLGIGLDQQSLPGVPQMLLEPHKGQVAHAAIQQIAAWLRRQTVDADLITLIGNAGETLEQVQLRVGDASITETAWRISEQPDLFGILSEPQSQAVEDRPIIVLLNAGAAYRIGPGRMNVEMSRRFSAEGFRCLRVDLGGLGDSIADDPSTENDSYAATAFRDITIILQALRLRFGRQRFVLMGLCSGAYASFQSAAQFADSDLVESVLINPLTFFWRDGMSLETAPTRELIREHYYLTSALQPRKWLKLFSGRSHIGLRGALKMVLQRLGLKGLRSRSSTVCHACTKLGPSHPDTEDLTGDLRKIVATKRQLSMFFATTDPGYSILTTQAGRQAKRMVHSGQLSLTFLDNADHTFSRQAARQRLIEALVRHLCNRYPA